MQTYPINARKHLILFTRLRLQRVAAGAVKSMAAKQIKIQF